MNNFNKQQCGMTFISMLMLLGVIAFGVLLILKVLPLYIEHGKVASAVAKLKEEPEIVTKTDFEVLNKLLKQFDIDDVEGVTKEDITVTKSGSYLKVEVSYEPEVKIIANLSIKLTFDDVFEVGQE